MISNAFKYLLILLTASMFFTACEEEISLDLKSDIPRLVVDGFITTDTMAHRVRLTTSGGYFDNKPMAGVSGAVVSLSDGEETIILVESDSSPGDYFTPDDYFGKQNHLYKLAITNVAVGNKGRDEVYTAESFLNPMVKMDSISVDYFKIWKMWRVLLYGRDPKNEKNYYWFRLKINDWWYSTEYRFTSYADDTYFDGNYAEGVWLFGLNAEDEVDFKPGDKIMVECWMVDEPFYNFINGAYQETEYKNPIFSGPPANVPGNISNGALGIFAASSVHRLYTDVTKSRDDFD